MDDTFARVLSRIAPSALQGCLVKWTQSLCDGSAGEVIAIDGKTVRRPHDHRRGQGPLHLVRAWATEAGLALAQVATVLSHAITFSGMTIQNSYWTRNWRTRGFSLL